MDFYTHRNPRIFNKQTKTLEMKWRTWYYLFYLTCGHFWLRHTNTLFFGSLWCVLFVYYGYVRACVWWQWLKFRCVECDNSTKLPCNRFDYAPLGGAQRSQPFVPFALNICLKKKKHLKISVVCPTIAVGLTEKWLELQLRCYLRWIPKMKVQMSRRTSISLIKENSAELWVCAFVK